MSLLPPSTATAAAVLSCPYDTCLDDNVMSNFDHEIDEAVATRLKTAEAYAPYSGWHFNGRVWWDRTAETWCCEVWCHHAPVDVVMATELSEIMRVVCERYGAG